MKEVEICPICGSRDVTFDKSNKLLEAISMHTNYICNRCGNTFIAPLEVDEDEYKELKEAPLTPDILRDTQNKIRVGGGYGYALIFIIFSIITIIIALIAGLFMR